MVRVNKRKLFFVLASMFFYLITSRVYAHHSQYSFLRIAPSTAPENFTGSLEIAQADMEYVLGLSLGEQAQDVSTYKESIAAYLLNKVRLSKGEHDCVLEPQDVSSRSAETDRYIVLAMSARCAQGSSELNVASQFMFDIDPEHRTMVYVGEGDSAQTTVLSFSARSAAITLQPASVAQRFVGIVYEGIVHIFIGYDHILFLLALLLPVFFLPMVEGNARRLLRVFAYCSVFTLAHSLTLALASLSILTPPPAVIEAAIALSIAIVAANNLLRWWQDGYVLIFALGLIHGFGFANVLQDLGLGAGEQLLTLAAFNLGVEAGQIMIVGCMFPVLLLLRGSQQFQQVVLRTASICCASVGVYWFIERSWFG